MPDLSILSRESSAMNDIEELATKIGMSAEHILLEDQEISLETSECPRDVFEEISFRNRIRGTVSTLTLFDDGYLSVVETRQRNVLRRCAFDVRCIDARPSVARRRARRLRSIVFGSAAIAMAAAASAYAGVFREAAVPLELAFGVLSPAAFWVYALRREDRVSFRTLHGRAAAIVLSANFGSIAACRSAARTLADAIAQVQFRNPLESPELLRLEIQEHYKLLRNGIISTPACRAALEKTLASF